MIRAIRSIILLVWALGALLLPLPPAALAAGEECFTEVNYCIDGRFRDFWRENGGVAVFGLPITGARAEPNAKQQVVETQWFQRNRFERNPGEAAPYDVLLGRLGDDLLRRRGIAWESLTRDDGPRAGCLWFEETRLNVCDQTTGSGFKTYWETHGLTDPRLDAYRRSLALFGLPLTQPRMETNTSGHTVLTQWFERARFEWHKRPDRDEFEVLLGLLGDEMRSGADLRPTPPPGISPPPVAMPPATPAGTCAQIAPAPADGARAWVTQPAPARGTQQTVCARLTAGGQPVAGAATSIRVRYKSTTTSYGPEATDAQGIAALTFAIGGATAGHTVVVDVTMRAAGRTYTARTEFTPR
jgi:hypothetical protein